VRDGVADEFWLLVALDAIDNRNPTENSLDLGIIVENCIVVTAIDLVAFEA